MTDTITIEPGITGLKGDPRLKIDAPMFVPAPRVAAPGVDFTEGLYVPRFGAALEHAIVRHLLGTLRGAGFVPVCVWDSERYVRATTQEEVLNAIFEVDADVTLHFGRGGDPEGTWGAMGVMLVQGNGLDLISDWHSAPEDFDRAVWKAVDALEEDRHALVLVPAVRPIIVPASPEPRA